MIEIKPKLTVLILGGTTEGYHLAAKLASRLDWRVINSLAGRTTEPRMPVGETRIGGFGGIEGLINYLREQQVNVVLDATHPFATTMGFHAAAACHTASIPLLRLERPPWQPELNDRWEFVTDWKAAIKILYNLKARRVLLTVGQQELAPFANLADIWLLIRLITPPDPALTFTAAQILSARGPFELADERALLENYAIDAIVCKNSGGTATVAKLIAARERGITVVMKQRPARPSVSIVEHIDDALSWLDTLKIV